jgi:hypothetical protein
MYFFLRPFFEATLKSFLEVLGSLAKEILMYVLKLLDHSKIDFDYVPRCSEHREF